MGGAFSLLFVILCLVLVKSDWCMTEAKNEGNFIDELQYFVPLSEKLDGIKSLGVVTSLVFMMAGLIRERS